MIFLMKKTCIVTGATGMIGRELIKILKKEWNIYSLGTNRNFDFDRNVKKICVDFNSDWDADTLPKQVDAVIHLAQSEHYREFPEYAESVFRVNVASTLKLMDYCRKNNVKSFVLASSGGIYGHGDEGFKEEDPYKPIGDLGFYLGSKLCSEVVADNFASFMNVVILRLFFVYGSGQKKYMLIPRLIENVKQSKPIFLDNEEGIKISPTYVQDAAFAIYHSLGLKKSEKINIAGPEILSIKQIGDTIGDILNKKVIYIKKGNVDSCNFIGDISKMKEILFTPKIFFSEGVKSIVNE